MDKPMEVLARHLLLLAAVTDWEVPVRHRANAFLELFGNTLVQRRTAKYISTKGRELENLLCDGVGSETLRSLIDFSLLKHRERDEMQRVFKSWDTSVPFNAQELHDRRLRVLYKDRYDFRKNVIDWDYQWACPSAAACTCGCSDVALGWCLSSGSAVRQQPQYVQRRRR